LRLHALIMRVRENPSPNSHRPRPQTRRRAQTPARRFNRGFGGALGASA
jgi:hypothetical protein